MSRLPLSHEHRRSLAAAADRVLPAGGGAGASDANVIGFIEWAMGQRAFQDECDRLVKGLAILDSLSAGMWGRRFEACTDEERDSVLKQLEATPHPTAQRFLSALVDMTLAGFLCHPRRGGNRDRIGWKFIGFKPHAFTWNAAADTER